MPEIDELLNASQDELGAPLEEGGAPPPPRPSSSGYETQEGGLGRPEPASATQPTDVPTTPKSEEPLILGVPQETTESVASELGAVDGDQSAGQSGTSNELREIVENLTKTTVERDMSLAQVQAAIQERDKAQALLNDVRQAWPDLRDAWVNQQRVKAEQEFLTTKMEAYKAALLRSKEDPDYEFDPEQLEAELQRQAEWKTLVNKVTNIDSIVDNAVAQREQAYEAQLAERQRSEAIQSYESKFQREFKELVEKVPAVANFAWAIKGEWARDPDRSVLQVAAPLIQQSVAQTAKKQVARSQQTAAMPVTQRGSAARPVQSGEQRYSQNMSLAELFAAERRRLGNG